MEKILLEPIPKTSYREKTTTKKRLFITLRELECSGMTHTVV